jgi:hypothetical protein
MYRELIQLAHALATAVLILLAGQLKDIALQLLLEARG